MDNIPPNVKNFFTDREMEITRRHYEQLQEQYLQSLEKYDELKIRYDALLRMMQAMAEFLFSVIADSETKQKIKNIMN